MSTFLDTLVDIERRYDDLERLLADPAVTTDHSRLQEVGRERSELEPVVSVFRELRETDEEISETEALSRDPEMAELAAEELHGLRERREALLTQVRTLLIPKDPKDEKDVSVALR